MLRLDQETFEVRARGATVGFIWKAGPVWVGLLGARQSIACEVAQSLEFDVAVAAVKEAADALAQAKAD